MRAFAVAAVAAPCCLALDNGFDRPPMGWSGLYGAPFGAVNETIMVRAAQGLLSRSMPLPALPVCCLNLCVVQDSRLCCWLHSHETIRCSS